MKKKSPLNKLPLPSWLFSWLSIRSKLQTIILLSSLAVILLTGTISYITAKNALQNSVYSTLTSLRARQEDTLNNYFDLVRREINTYSESNTIRYAFQQMKLAYNELEKITLTSIQEEQLETFYKNEVIPKLESISNGNPIVESYLPQSNAGKYLQYYYMANNPYPVNQKGELNSAIDGSRYSQIHETMHPIFHRFAKNFQYYDIIMIDPESGEVIYTTAKEIDLGTNLKTGIYSGTSLGQVYREVLNSRDPDFVTNIDFQNYRPSYDAPASFIAATIYNDNDFIGVLAFQVAIERINQAMTINRKWREVGLGDTGESILVGPDYLLRTEPRLYLENPDLYFEELRNNGYSQEQINRIWETGTPILQHKIDTDIVKKAFDGKEGTELTTDFRGHKILASYKTITVGIGNDIQWALITKMDEKEAFAPINRLGYLLFATSAVLLPFMVLLANWLSNLFIGPIKRLLNASRRMAAGENDVQVQIESDDEFGELAHAFNLMSYSLSEKEERLYSQIQENRKLLLSILPPDAVEKFLGGDRDFADIYKNVSIIYAEIENLSELVSHVSPEKSLQLLNELIGAFDELTELYGVEKIKTMGTTYIAVSGLSLPRIDHAKRAVDFAVAMISAIKQYSIYHDGTVTLDIGIHSGSIVGGIVGKTKFIYEIWGDTLKIAQGIHSSSKNNVIQVTEPVYRELHQIYNFKPIEKITVKGIGDLPVWELDLTSTTIGDMKSN